jgi:hypothetical protein
MQDKRSFQHYAIRIGQIHGLSHSFLLKKSTYQIRTNKILIMLDLKMNNFFNLTAAALGSRISDIHGRGCCGGDQGRHVDLGLGRLEQHLDVVDCRGVDVASEGDGPEMDAQVVHVPVVLRVGMSVFVSQATRE